MDATAAPISRRDRIRAILSGSSGNLVEWFDFYVYASFSLYFAKAFFPAGDQTAQLLSTAAIFAFGFLMRPLGAWYFGRVADRRGRRFSLMVSVLMMCLGSGLIAIIPTYATAGVAAPVLLLTARLIQGFSLGGEYGTSATYLSEMADANNRGFYSSFQYVTLIGGQLGAMLVLLLLQKVVLTPAQLDDWGWRIPFALGAVLALVAYRMRRDMIETPAVAVSSLDARYRRGRHELRGQWSMVNISGAANLNRALQIHTGLSPNIASRLLGAYGEAATRVTPDSWSDEILVFGRYEKFDTQNKMPPGFLPLQEFQRSAWVAGATYYPDPDVAFKFDFVRERNKSGVVRAPWRINAGVGWWF